MNKKGQALVEFIIVFPIIIMLMIALFDYVKIITTKANLESLIEDKILDDNTIIDDDITYYVDHKDQNNIYSLCKRVDISSVVLTPIIGNNYKVCVERVLYE